MGYVIFDEDQTPQRFPLQRLARAVRDALGTDIGCFVFRVDGYGMRVHQLATALDALPREQGIPISFDELDRLSAGVQEWFFDITVEAIAADGVRVKFGIFDSAFMFVEAESPLAERLTVGFADVRKDE